MSSDTPTSDAVPVSETSPQPVAEPAVPQPEADPAPAPAQQIAEPKTAVPDIPQVPDPWRYLGVDAYAFQTPVGIVLRSGNALCYVPGVKIREPKSPLECCTLGIIGEAADAE